MSVSLEKGGGAERVESRKVTKNPGRLVIRNAYFGGQK